jgi:hypothetical protein
MEVQQFIARWSASGASERANKDSYLKDLCDVLGVPHPEPRIGDRGRDVSTQRSPSSASAGIA